MGKKTPSNSGNRGATGKPKRKAPPGFLAVAAPKWEPGVSGNPNGRPKGSRNRATIMREWLECKATDGGAGTKADELARAQIIKAAKGDTYAYSAVMDSAFGRLKEVHEITGKDGGPMESKKIEDMTDEEVERRYKELIKQP